MGFEHYWEGFLLFYSQFPSKWGPSFLNDMRGGLHTHTQHRCSFIFSQTRQLPQAGRQRCMRSHYQWLSIIPHLKRVELVYRQGSTHHYPFSTFSINFPLKRTNFKACSREKIPDKQAATYSPKLYPIMARGLIPHSINILANAYSNIKVMGWLISGWWFFPGSSWLIPGKVYI